MTISEVTKVLFGVKEMPKISEHETLVVAIAMRFNLLNIECNKCTSRKWIEHEQHKRLWMATIN